MKNILNRLINHEHILREEAKGVLIHISKGHYNSSQIASFLTVYMMRNISIEELQGFRDALQELCIPVNLSGYNTVDLCGTGGDGKNTFNISTIAAFITAGAGVNVTKHGNYGVSSACGSSNVLDHLGVKFSSDSHFLQTCLEKAGICILHAPLFHPAMKNVAPIRRELGVKTFFNMLGPMVNPANPENQIVGVFSLELLRVYSYLYQNSTINYSIVHALDGYDEISLTGSAKVHSNLSEYMINPSHFGLETVTQSAIYGGDSVASSANIFKHIINGQGTKQQNNVVCANAALAISTVKQIPISESFNLAQESLNSGQAKKRFDTLLALSQG